MRHNLILLLVDRNTDYAHLSLPLRVLLNHLVVVLHGFLAGRAPCGPEIEKHDCAVMFKVKLIERFGMRDPLERRHGVFDIETALNLGGHGSWVDALLQPLEGLAEGSHLLEHLVAASALGDQDVSVVDVALLQVEHALLH